MSYVVLDTSKIKKPNDLVIDYYDPSKCFYRVNKDDKVIPKKNTYICKGDPIFFNNKQEVIYSTISGNYNSFDKTKSLITITNDYKEYKKKRNGVNKIKPKYLKKEFSNIINKCNISLNVDKDYRFIVFNGVVSEKFNYTNIFLVRENTLMLLEAANAIVNTLNATKGIVVISSNYENVINKVLDNVGSYPKLEVKVLPAYYPLHNDIFLSRYIGLNKDTNCFISISKLYEIAYALKREEPISEKYITVSGPLVENPCIVNCKIGSSLQMLLKDVVKVTPSNSRNIYVNGYLSDNIVHEDEYIIDKNTEYIVIDNSKELESSSCINCGLCSDVCPMRLQPKKNIKIEVCLRCNLCSYVCPANIDILKERDNDGTNS